MDLCLASKPKYPQRKIERTKLTEPVCTEIEYWLAENAKRRQTGMRKQCLKRQDIHRCLIEKGFNVSYSSVCKLNMEIGSLATGNKREALRRDLECMLRFPGDFGCFDLLQCSVDKQSTISVRGCHYSVPDLLAGQTVIVKLYSEKIRVYDTRHKKVAEHERSYSAGSWTLDINHYITTLMRKPGALDGSVALRQMPAKMQELFRVHFADNTPLAYAENQKSDVFLEIELGSKDVLSQLDGIMQGSSCDTTGRERRCAL